VGLLLCFRGSRDRPIEPDLPQPGCTVLEGHRCWVYALAFSPDSSLLASAAAELHVRGEGKIWDVRPGPGKVARLRADLSGPRAALYALAFAPDGRSLFAGGCDTPVRCYDTRTGQLRDTLTRRLDRVLDLAALPGGRAHVVSYQTHEATISVRDTASTREVLTCRGLPTSAFSPDGKLLALISPAGDAVHVQELIPPHQKTVVLNVIPSGLHVLAFSGDGRTLAVGSEDGSVTLWDLSTNEFKARIVGQAPVTAVALGPDSLLLAAAGNDRTLQLWDVATGRKRADLRGHTGTVYCLAFSGDGRLLASGGFDRTVRLWDLSLAP
jgi:WD40 repeat protein